MKQKNIMEGVPSQNVSLICKKHMFQGCAHTERIPITLDSKKNLLYSLNLVNHRYER